MFYRGNPPWNKGQTKETDSRIAKGAAALAHSKRGTKCSIKTRAKMSKAHKGRVVSVETRIKIGAYWRGRKRGSISNKHRMNLSAGHRKHVAANILGCMCGPCGYLKRWKNTNLERILREVVLAEFPKVHANVKFGPYEVDAYLPPPYHLAFEADGAYWHNLPGRATRDKLRDRYLLDNFKLIVVRLSEEELKKWEV